MSNMIAARRVAPALLAAAIVLTVGGDLEAQARTRATLLPFIGTLNPVGAVHAAPILDAAANVVDYEDFTDMWAFGGALEVMPATLLPIGVRVSVSRSAGASETGQWGCAAADGQPSACPSILILVPTEIALTTATVDAVTTIPVGRMQLLPYLGLGWVRYAYSWDPGDVGSFSLAPGSTSDGRVGLHLGMAARVSVAGLGLRAGYSMHASPARVRPVAPNQVRSLTLGLELPVR